jgi:hypothetical protein
MSMTKSDYLEISTIIYFSALDDGNRIRIAQEFARDLAETNSKFNRSKFLQACGIMED